jgi:ABC-type antimicrobial peptide transport system permease subunit
LREPVRRILERLDPGVGIARVTTVDAQFDEALRRERLLAALGIVFGGLALMLVAIGLYGMLNTMVVRRTPEIGVRMALGAARSRIAWMIVRETFLVLSIGVGLGVTGHIAAARLVRSQLFGVEPSDPTAPIAAVLGLVAIALIAVWPPARRATLLDPMCALRSE